MGPRFIHRPRDIPTNLAEPTAERVAFLAGEPDRWRNTPDLPLRHFNGPDHYIDLEQLALETTATVPTKRTTIPPSEPAALEAILAARRRGRPGATYSNGASHEPIG